MAKEAEFSELDARAPRERRRATQAGMDGAQVLNAEAARGEDMVCCARAFS